jgi:hypothetical protein
MAKIAYKRQTINMSKAGQNMVLITKQRRYKVGITSKEYFS